MLAYFFAGFLAAPLAGAAFFVDAALAFGAADFSGLAGAAFSAFAGAAFSAFGAVFSVFAGAAFPAFGVSAFGASAFAGFAFGSAFLSPTAVILKIVCCWRWPFVRR
jgi:hypothetical protein